MPRDLTDGEAEELLAKQGAYELQATPSPRAYTAEEVAKRLVQSFVNTAQYWATEPACGSLERRCHGVAFSILSMLDGSSIGLPAFTLRPDPAPEDKQYHIDQGENYYDPDTELSTYLHEIYHKTQREMYPKEKEPHQTLDGSTAREVIQQAAVNIANYHAAQDINRFDACHATAKDVLGIFDGNAPHIPPMMVTAAPSAEFNRKEVAEGREAWVDHIPINRRSTHYGTADELLAEGYDNVRRRSIAAAKELFGK